MNERIILDTDEFICAKTRSAISKEKTSSQVFKEQVVDFALSAPEQQVNKKIGADSAFSTSTCAITTQQSVENFTCIINSLPKRLILFLFSPINFSNATSLDYKLASFENVLWLFTFVLLGILLIKRKWPQEFSLRFILLLHIVFIVLYSTVASLFEGNSGTAFRHKGTILFSLISSILITSLQECRVGFKQMLKSSKLIDTFLRRVNQK